MTKFCNERDHIQKIIERHLWLFGERYHLLTADKNLATSLAEFERITECQLQTDETVLSKSELLQRMDIFLYSQQIQEDSSSEMLIIELKAPSISLSLDVYNQVVKYVNTIRKELRFIGNNRYWRFYAVCATVDDDVKVKYENFKHLGKIGLVDVIDKYEIYALSWDDVFQSFEARHNFLLSGLKLDLSQLKANTEKKEFEIPSRELVDQISKELISEDAR
jgi:hypothetical protein